ncbi:unnamed protein product [Rotaria magnacalcarata]|uniref:BTB domain-containing protein n=3 Tax=Rotaria magnacalcarata TaxID=392030 RepID=A0A815N6G1_9BILA|nr:unnamed protein product [Rotaria magnacalcarata]CAF1430688.1 unnamed protein product [Rotaria magnacalcarata]CAF1901374.1 unnamed protein product [Rotaria magnacalcarata]
MASPTTSNTNNTAKNKVPGSISQNDRFLDYDSKTLTLINGTSTTNSSNDLVHSQQLIARMNKLRKAEHLCDVTLKVEQTLFLAHRLVLAAASDYFAAMFTGEMVERHMNIIELKGFNASVMEILLNSIYGESVTVTNDNVQDILPAASLLQLNGTDIQRQCALFLASHLEPANCLGIYCFADLHNCSQLKQTALSFIWTHFAAVVHSDEFLTLKANEVEELIQSDEIEVPNEEIIYNCVMAWLKHDQTFRQQYLLTLLQHVRLPFLSARFITDICDTDPLVRSSHKCRDLLDEAKRYHLRPDCRKVMTGTRFTSRRGKDEHLIVAGGFGAHQRPVDIVERWNPRTNEWTSLQSLTKRRRYAAAAAIGKRLYVVGGYDGRQRMNSVECLDLSQENATWQPVASLTYRRALPGVCVHQNLIYVCGGFDGSLRLASTECYDEKTDVWTIGEDMHVGREGAGLVSIDDHLYCIGGYDGLSLLQTVEKYDINLGRWSQMAPMLTPRSGAGCATIDHYIFACGGFDGTIHLSSVERYDSQTNQWTNVTSMSVRRCYCGSAFIRGRIAVIGGYDGTSLLDTVEVYDSDKDEWTIESQMLTPRCDSGFACVAYRQ